MWVVLLILSNLLRTALGYVPPAPSIVQQTANSLKDYFFDIDQRTMRKIDTILGLYKEFKYVFWHFSSPMTLF